MLHIDDFGHVSDFIAHNKSEQKIFSSIYLGHNMTCDDMRYGVHMLAICIFLSEDVC